MDDIAPAPGIIASDSALASWAAIGNAESLINALSYATEAAADTLNIEADEAHLTGNGQTADQIAPVCEVWLDDGRPVRALRVERIGTGREFRLIIEGRPPVAHLSPTQTKVQS